MIGEFVFFVKKITRQIRIQGSSIDKISNIVYIFMLLFLGKNLVFDRYFLSKKQEKDMPVARNIPTIEWEENQENYFFTVGFYEIVVFKSMLEESFGNEPAIYTHHSGKKKIYQSLTVDDLQGQWTIDHAKVAILKKFCEIAHQEIAHLQLFLASRTMLTVSID